MKVIALDIDGVLNSEKSRLTCEDFDENFCPIACNNLRELIKQVPDVKFVISSSWRKVYSLNELRHLLNKHAGVPKRSVIGKTPEIRGSKRVDEIRDWMNQRPHITHYAIIDDDLIEDNNFVHTDFKVGLTEDDAVKVLKLLT